MGFFLIGGFVSLIAGYLTDRSNRINLYFAIVLLGEASCIYAYCSTTYKQLYYSRVLTGISIGGAAPIIYSLLADYYPSSVRIYVGMIVSVSMNMGAALGQLMAGSLAPRYGWRLPFLLVAVPAILCALLMYLTVKEPIRGSQDFSPIDELDDHKIEMISQSETIDFQKCTRLFQRPTIVIALLQGIPGCIPWGVIGTYLNDYLSYDVGFTTTEATYAITCLGFGIMCGQLLGGTIGQWLYNRNPVLQCAFMGCSTMLGTIPMLFIINIQEAPQFMFGTNQWESRTSMYNFTLFLSFTTGLIAAITGPNIRSVLQNVSPPELRGTVFSFFNLTDDLGKGGGPYLIALLTTYSGSRRFSFSVGISFWLICGSLLTSMAWTVRADENAVRLRLLDSSKKLKGDISGDEFETQAADFTTELQPLLKPSGSLFV